MDKQKRNTKTKEMVMDVFTNASSALCYDELEQQLAGQVNRVTIYRILQNFCNDGKVTKSPTGTERCTTRCVRIAKQGIITTTTCISVA